MINEILDTQSIICIEKNKEKIIPIIFYDKEWNKNILPWNKKVFDCLGINMNYLSCPFPGISHGQVIDSFIKQTINIADYWLFMESDSIPLRADLVDIFHDKVKDKQTIVGQAQQSNHIFVNGTKQHVYASPGCLMFSKDLYLKLGSPSFHPNERSDTAEELSWRAKENGLNLCLIYPSHSEVENTDLDNGLRYGMGNTYNNFHYHVMNQGDPESSILFINKCKEIINLNTKSDNWEENAKNLFPDNYINYKDDTQQIKQYNLLRKYSNEFNDELFLDIGTDLGFSAFVLGENGQNNVLSFDIIDFNRPTKDKVEKLWPNIKYNIFNLLDPKNKQQTLDLFKKAKLMYIDVDNHDGIKELQLYLLIKESGFKGITIWDDIHLNQGMENFWNNIQERKEDATKDGHGTGTGIIYFD